MGENQLMDFELLSPAVGEQYNAQPQIFFVLNGKLAVGMAGSTLILSEKDFLILNSFQSYSAEVGESGLVMRFFVNLEKLNAYYDISKLEFLGNSMEEDSQRHMRMRRLLEKCIAYYYGKRAGNGRILLKLNSLYYEIAELLISSFSIVKNDRSSVGKETEEALIQEMSRYIQVNYRSALRLEDLADHFFLSPAYISRFFKKKLGINFNRYLTEIRLNEAVKKLENTEKSLTWIAMDCGFPNIASFNKAFKEKYQMNPKSYRASGKKQQKSDSFERENTTEQAEYQLLDYLEKNENILEDDYEEIEQIEADTGSYTILTKNWNKMINIGGVYLLLQKEIQDHTVFLCKTLGFEYVRVWDLYEKRMHINVANREKKYNFSRLDACLDFLTLNHIKPYIELGFKPFILLRNYEDYIFHEEREIPFQRPGEYGDFVRNMMKHLVNRYSVQEISTWIFEVWCDPRWFPEGNAAEYILYFEEVYQAVKELSPNTRVGGAYDRSYSIIQFEKFIQAWSVRSIQPDFISLYCYASLPLDQIALGKEENRIAAADNVRNFRNRSYVEERKRLLMQYGMTMPVLCSEWNFTVINNNVINDSRFKGAYVMKEIMDMYQEMDMMGYWFGTDLFAEDDDAPMLLNGRCGLITHQGICKPAYWAFLMMNRLENYLLKKTANTMISRDDFDSYVIACHNYRELDIQYYVQEERYVTVESIPHLYADNRELIIKINITGVQNGTYHIKTRAVNSQYGGVQDEWVRMGQVEFLTNADVEYINHMSRPHTTVSEQIVSDHTLHFTVKLEAQEMQLLHVFRYMEE